MPDRHEYRGLLVNKYPAAVMFALPSAPDKVVATARLRTGGIWSLRIPDHTWAVDSHPLNQVPGDGKIEAVSFKGFPTWQAAAREVIKVLGVQPARTYDGLNGAVHVGDVLAYWWDTGAMGAQLHHAKVLKLGPVKIRIMYEGHHDVAWVYPHKFDRIVDPATLAQLREEGLDL